MAAVYSVRAGSAGGAAGVAFLIENGGSPSQNDERLSRVGSGQAGLDLGAAGQPADAASRTMPTEEAMQTKAKQREDGLHTKLWEVWESAGETVRSGDSAKDEKGRGRQPIDIRLSVMAVTRRGLPIESITGAEALVESCGDREPQKKKRATEQSISSSRGETLGSPVYER
ncbi:UNVERIFIED_CONTAM: hypothetical protein FKN15_028540 [Acipenser sinensis]